MSLAWPFAGGALLGRVDEYLEEKKRDEYRLLKRLRIYNK